MPNLGPGTLTFGETGTEIDASCEVNNLRITVSKDQEDSTTKLCGTTKPGATSYTYALEGNTDTDVEDPDGFFAMSQLAKGTEVPFVFVPNTAAGTQAAGTVVMDPLEFGADEYGATLDSDFEFTLVGEPAYTYGGAAVEAGGTKLDALMDAIKADPSRNRLRVNSRTPLNKPADESSSSSKPAASSKTPAASSSSSSSS